MGASFTGGNPRADATVIEQRPANDRKDKTGQSSGTVHCIEVPGNESDRALYLDLGVETCRFYPNPRGCCRQSAFGRRNIGTSCQERLGVADGEGGNLQFITPRYGDWRAKPLRRFAKQYRQRIDGNRATALELGGDNLNIA
ncbi:hypothetical protein D3C72_1998190 [compost metagenome]